MNGRLFRFGEKGVFTRGCVWLRGRRSWDADPKIVEEEYPRLEVDDDKDRAKVDRSMAAHLGDKSIHRSVGHILMQKGHMVSYPGGVWVCDYIPL